jgi:hypothetical protein
MRGFFLWPSATSAVNLYRKYTTSIFLQIEVSSITQHLGYKMRLSPDPYYSEAQLALHPRQLYVLVNEMPGQARHDAAP